MDAFERDIAAPFGMTPPGGSGLVRVLPPNTLTAPATGTYMFGAWSAGAGFQASYFQPGASGAFAMRTLFMRAGQAITNSGTASSPIWNFPDGQKPIALTPATASPATGVPSSPGTATGGDVALNGSAPGVAGLGSGGGAAGGPTGTNSAAGAPAVLPFIGGWGGLGAGTGGTSGTANGATPGGGGAGTSSNVAGSTGAALTMLIQIG